MGVSEHFDSTCESILNINNPFLILKSRVFTFCFAIIDVVVFIQPQWIGDTVESKGTGYFGLWKHCSLVQGGQEIICKGQLEDFGTILNPAFRAATVFVGLSVVVIVLCLCAMLFFFFFSPSTVFHICGWLQFFSGKDLSVVFVFLYVRFSSNARLHTLISFRTVTVATAVPRLVYSGCSSSSTIQRMWHVEFDPNID